MTDRFYYDLHIHSCLSPCGDDDNTPNNIAGMATLSELDIVALTDHNTCKNCPAFFEAAEKYGIVPIAGMELTTSEDIHIVCLFETLDEAMTFDRFVEEHRILIKNRPEFFGEQWILNSQDEPIAKEEHLLSNATTISSDDVYAIVKKFGGICYPAHIDRDSNSITAVLGTIPPDSEFSYFEIHDGENADLCESRYGVNKDRLIVSSDAHCLTDIRDKENYFLLDADRSSPDDVRSKLFGMLRKNKHRDPPTQIS